MSVAKNRILSVLLAGLAGAGAGMLLVLLFGAGAGTVAATGVAAGIMGLLVGILTIPPGFSGPDSTIGNTRLNSRIESMTVRLAVGMDALPADPNNAAQYLVVHPNALTPLPYGASYDLPAGNFQRVVGVHIAAMIQPLNPLNGQPQGPLVPASGHHVVDDDDDDGYGYPMETILGFRAFVDDTADIEIIAWRTQIVWNLFP